ncbi:hypothetical protein ACQY0O_005448 [Thecaphora frezii]
MPRKTRSTKPPHDHDVPPTTTTTPTSGAPKPTRSKSSSSTTTSKANSTKPSSTTATTKPSKKTRALSTRSEDHEHHNTHDDQMRADQGEANTNTPNKKQTRKAKVAVAVEEQEEHNEASKQMGARKLGKKQRLPEDQVETFLENYDLETTTRLSRLHSNLALAIEAAKTRMELSLSRIPRAVRELTLAEFVDEYGADIHAFMGRAPIRALQEGQKEWDEIKEQTSSPRKKRRGEEEEGREGKRKSTGKRGRRAKDAKKEAPPTRAASKARSRTRSSTASRKPHPRDPSPAGDKGGKATSSHPFPTLTRFSPDLETARIAKPGEFINFTSINGSPICGVLGADGVVRPMTFLKMDPGR